MQAIPILSLPIRRHKVFLDLVVFIGNDFVLVGYDLRTKEVLIIREPNKKLETFCQLYLKLKIYDYDLRR